MSVSIAENKITIVKFFYNDKRTKNQILTRTLGKIGVIDSTKIYVATPKSNEFWKVKIIKETRPGQNEGCFVLEPLEKVNIEDTAKLVPGMYDEHLYTFNQPKIDGRERTTGLLIMKPKNPGHHWVLPLKLKQSIMDIKNTKRHRLEEIYAIIVDLTDESKNE